MNADNHVHGDLKIASSILEWEIGDIWGHVGVRTADSRITVKLFRTPEVEGEEDWIIDFDYSLNKLSGVGIIPNEAVIYTEIFKARPDVNAITHAHAPMCIALSMANKQIATVHLQSKKFAGGIPVFPKPIFILDDEEGKDLAKALGNSVAVVIRGHGIVTVGRTIKEACMTALYLERTAKIQAVAQTLGFEKVDQNFIDQVNVSTNKLASTKLSRDKTAVTGGYDAEWSYYKRKVLRGEYWSRGWV
jgi:ribulose-5-phosphate 4-epimerase/fuculose-1-phosphate aldolase